MAPDLTKALRAFIREQGLPEDYLKTVRRYLVPLAEWIASQKHEKPLVIGINGAQGSGKSTMAAALAIILKLQHGYKIARLSIDDLYLTQAERLRLAEVKHPLFKTRGVPGTHDVWLGIDTINSLITESGELLLPQFDKSIDDRAPEALWSCIKTPVDIVLFEGWCVATAAQSDSELIEPINELEAGEDEDGGWRQSVNEALKSEYRRLFGLIDALVFLKAPGFDAVYKWRAMQESKTFVANREQGMNRKQLDRFIQHYERLTRFSLSRLPEVSDVILELNSEQEIIRSLYK